jgi:hypothetical protein
MQQNRPILIPELIPRSSWFNNLRSLLAQDQWDIIRKQAYRAAGYRCEICGGKGEKWPVEAHERWWFDDKNSIQYLDGLIALCPLCHKVKHIGFTEIRGGVPAYIAARAWMARINNWSEDVCEIAIREEFQRWEERNRINWKVDYSQAPYIVQGMVRDIIAKREEGREANRNAAEFLRKKEAIELTKRAFTVTEINRQQDIDRTYQKFLASIKRKNRRDELLINRKSGNQSDAERTVYEVTRRRQEVELRAQKQINSPIQNYRVMQFVYDEVIAPQPKVIRKLRLEE